MLTLLCVELIVGEDAHLKGEDGVRRAKRWLEATMRVKTVWVNTGNDAVKRKLAYTWPVGGRPFSFDLGGIMRAGEFDGHMFSAEVKNYAEEYKQPELYRRFLAQCCVALGAQPGFCDHFMWITWVPFSSSRWHELCTETRVRTAVLEHRDRIFGDVDAAAAAALVDEERVKKVSDRLWLVVISEKQERLVPLREWRAVVEGAILRGEVAE